MSRVNKPLLSIGVIGVTLAVSLMGGCTTSAPDTKLNDIEENKTILLKAAEDAKTAAETSIKTERTKTPANQTSSIGPLCWAVFLEVASQYGTRCVAQEDPLFRASLDGNLQKLDARFLALGWSKEQLATFKKEQIWVDAPKAKLCKNADIEGIYRHMEKGGPEPLNQNTAAVIAHPGSPVWGDCI